MADYMAAQITIGGRIPHRLVPKLCSAIARQCVGLEWGDTTFRPETAQDLLEVRCQLDGRLYLRLSDDEVAYGQFRQVEEFLVRHKIPYDRHSEGKYKHDPVFVFFRPPRAPIALLATSAGHVVTHAEGLWSLAAKFSAENSRGDARTSSRSFVRRLRRALPPQPPRLPEFDISPIRPAHRVTRPKVNPQE